MRKGADYRLDWRNEFQRLSRYVEGVGGVVLLEYASEHAAARKFNHLLKEEFARAGNGIWRSLRVDHEWFTTRQAAGVLDENDRLLTEVGFEAEVASDALPSINILHDVEVRGDMTTNINGLEIKYGNTFTGRMFRAKAEAVFSAMRKYVEIGGRFMVELNDMPLTDQTEFWLRLWHAGLAEAGGDNTLLVIHAGPEAGQQQHHDSPEPDLRIILPDAIEDGSERDNHFFDDLIDAFAAAGVDEPAPAAAVHLENNRSSVLLTNMKLSAAIMAARRGQER